MEIYVIKSGAETFDTLHAYGVGIALAYLTDGSATLEDVGVSYRLTGPIVPDRSARLEPTHMFAHLLSLPNSSEIEAVTKPEETTDYRIGNLDGLLAALFTTPGPRCISVSDVLQKHRYQPAAIDDALHKASSAVGRLQKSAAQNAKRGQNCLACFDNYTLARLSPSIPGVKSATEIAIPMTLEAAYSYAMRRATSDGRLAEKSNVSILDQPWASHFAYLGAARFLRAQRVANGLVNYYIPIASKMTLLADSSRPLLSSLDRPSDHVLAQEWLSLIQAAQQGFDVWAGLAYQTLQTQGAQQSISLQRGRLDCTWLSLSTKDLGPTIFGQWKWLLRNTEGGIQLGSDDLAYALLHRESVAWVNHLSAVARRVCFSTESKLHRYQFTHIKEITTRMTTPSKPLATILERDKGTLSFGRAIRLLGQQNSSAFRDIIDVLEVAQTIDQLMRILARAAQECEIATAKTEFMRVPTDDDLKFLLEDVANFGPRTVCSVLIILASLRYPRANNETASSEATSTIS